MKEKGASRVASAQIEPFSYTPRDQVESQISTGTQQLAHDLLGVD